MVFTRTRTPEAEDVNRPGPARSNGHSGSGQVQATEADPAERKEESAGKPLLAVTGDHAAIEGDFKVADSLRIECEIGGTLEIGGKVVIGTNGRVQADVQTVDALILGAYEGNLVATGEVEIAASGRVTGNIRTDSLVINKGGFFNGTVEAITEEPDAPTESDGDAGGSETAPLAAVASGNGRASENGSGAHAEDAGEDASASEDESEDTAFLGRSAEAVAANV